MEENHWMDDVMAEDIDVEPDGGDEGLDETSVRIFEASYDRYRRAMERLAEL